MKLSPLRTIATVITVASVAGFVALAIPASGADTANNRYINVTGVGTVPVVPDAVRFNVTVSVVGVSNSAALSAASKAANAVRIALKNNDIALRDTRSASISVYPEYTWTQESGTKITGYRGSQSFDVLVRKASVAGIVVEAVVNAGGDAVQLGGIIPVILNSAAAAEKARAAAVANAKAKASSYAKLLGTSLGKVLSLEETSSPVYSSPYPMTAKAGTVNDMALEIDLGEQDVTVSISLRWSLN
jgi:uncharacterized protein YggE